MDLSHRIVTARKKKGLTQEQLADLTRVTVRTIQRIESGESAPRSHTIKAIATALDTSFEELTAVPLSNAPSLQPSTDYNMEDGKHLLQMICLSSFSFLVIPLVPFLVPAFLLKRSGERNPKIVGFARRIIKTQIYWMAALCFLLLLTMAYNFVRVIYFEKTHLLNYLWPFFLMYILNAIILLVTLVRINKTDFSFS
jgi:transcriptional regulator with XRE-family HTH domain